MQPDARSPAEDPSLVDGVGILEDALSDAIAHDAPEDMRRVDLELIRATHTTLREHGFVDDIELLRYVGCRGPFTADGLRLSHATAVKVRRLRERLEQLADVVLEISDVVDADNALIQLVIHEPTVRDAVLSGDAQSAVIAGLSSKVVLELPSPLRA